jgi:HMG (high mobility group) box
MSANHSTHQLGLAMANAMAKFAEFAAEMAEAFHQDLGLEYVPKKSGAKRRKTNNVVRRKSGYMVFAEIYRAKLKSAGKPNPSMKEVGEAWNALSQAEKAKYEPATTPSAGAAGTTAAAVTEVEESDEYSSEDDDVPPPQ